jgi:hypothetical protein
MTLGIPAAAASSAAATLLSMPPLPIALPGRNTALLAALPSAITAALASSTPSTEVRSTSSCARTSIATCAASVSLSPKEISSVAVASFSFTTGTTPMRCSSWNVLRALT